MQLSHVLNGLKFTLAVPGAQILSEGMTQAEVHAAMQQLRGQSQTTSEAPRSSVSDHPTPLMQAAAWRLSQETALSSTGDNAPNAAVAARRVSTEAASAAALLQEASVMSRLGAGQPHVGNDEDEMPEPLDVQVAVSLAEACAQVWR